jgi:hypothetical protein
MQQERAKQDKATADLKERADAKSRVERMLSSITAAGYETLYSFVDELLNVRDQQISSRVSKMLGQHGEDILNMIRSRQPDLVTRWAVGISGEVLAQEGQQLADYLRPGENQSTSQLLLQFSLERIMFEAEHIAPNLCHMLRQVTTNTKPSANEKVRKDRSLVRVVVISFKCELAQPHLGTGHCDLHACTDTSRTIERVSNYHVHIFACMWCFSHPV